MIDAFIELSLFFEKFLDQSIKEIKQYDDFRINISLTLK